ncbi:MAG: RHS repeat protein [Chlamydiales bacterium]|nr:RHS repeat protein [Chlamydiales bacterium]
MTRSNDEKETYAWAEFHYDYPDKEHLKGVKITTSDHQVIHYGLDPYAKNDKRRHWLLTAITYPERPNESYRYAPGGKGGFYLCHKRLPDGRELKIDYYGRNVTKLPLGEVKIKDEHDSKYKSVSTLLAPLGKDHNFFHAFQIFYHPGKFKEKGGHTNAYDALENLTQYQYDKNFMLTSRKRFIGKDKLFSEDLFHWYPEGTIKANWIQGKTLLDERGNPLLAYLYHYDDKGNVIQEDLWGDLSGNGKKLERNGSQFPHNNGVECFAVKREYYLENLLYRESVPNGSMVEYHYCGGTDRIHSKYHYHYETIKKREFFHYDGGILVKEIVDDGLTKDVNDLSGVSQRLIKKITPRKGKTFNGFPEVIEELYWDVERRLEVPLKRQVIDYNKRGLVSKIDHYDGTNTYRYSLTFDYDEKGRIISQTDPLGRTRIVSYDQNNNQTSESDPNEAFAVYRSYDFSNRVVLEEKNGRGNVKRALHREYNLLGHKVIETSDQGVQTFFESNAFGHPERITLPKLMTDQGAQTPIIQKKYNALGKVTLEVDPEGNETRTFYTSLGKPYRIVYPDGFEEHFRYDLCGNLIKHTSPRGVESHFIYDYQNRILSKKIIQDECSIEERYRYNTFHLVEKVDPDGVSTQYFYDGAGRKIKEVTEERETFFSYDEMGRLELVTNESQVIQTKYDLLNRIVEELELDRQGNLYGWTRYSYDDYSNKCAVTKEVQVGEAIQKTKYDPFRRIVKEVNAIGEVTEVVYDDYFKDNQGQTVTQKLIRDPKGRETKETYDAHGNLATLERFGPDGRLLVCEKFLYNLKGKKIKQISNLYHPDKTIVKTWKYDMRDRVVELREGGEKKTSYSYTPDGQLATLTKPDGKVIRFSYDWLGREVELKASDGSCHYTFKYDRLGRVIESKDELTGLATKRNYNHFGELIHETLATGISLNRKYDNLGRLKELIFSDHSKVVYGYDPYHLRSVKRLDSDGVEFYEHTYDEYDKSHHLIREFYPGSIGPAHHQVDLLGRRVRTDSIYSSEIIAEIDPTGNVTKYLRDHNDQQEVIEYTYDDLDQLTSETGLFTHQYAYDAHHNRLQKDEESCEVDSLHQLLAQGETTHRYDPNGNRISTQKEAQEISYTYDALDRLTHIRSGSQAIRLSYDSWGRCLTRTYATLQEGEWNSTQTEYFLYDGQNELGIHPHELRILGQGKGAEIGAAIAIEKGDGFYIPIHDLFGNVIASMGWDGTCYESYRHSAYGEEKIFNEDVTLSRSFINPWRYQSKRKIGGLINFGRRFYDPETGRWLSPDPKGFDEGPNLYQYLQNSPLLLFDLYGEAVERIRDIEEMEKQLKWDLDFERQCGGPFSRNFTYYPDRDYSPIANHPIVRGEKQIGYIGGIGNPFEEHLENVKTLSRYAGDVPIHSTYNATHGFQNDVREAKMGLNLIGTTPAALSFQRKAKFFANAPEDAVYFQVAHSQGAIHEVISQLMMPQEHRDRTVFLGIAPAMYMPKSLCRNTFHYQSMRDFIPYLQKAFGVVDNNAAHVEVLRPHPEAPLFDHSFRSPTYKQFLVDHIDDYLLGVYD